MQTKLKLSTIFFTVILALIIPLSTITANATTFTKPIPAFSLYCDNPNVEISGNVKYVIDEDGQAVQHSKYQINAASENVTLYIPFIANAFTIPQIDIDVSGEICYGAPYGLFTDKIDYEFFSTDIGDMAGTIYTLIPNSESFTIDFTMLANQNFIYTLTNNYTNSRSDRRHTYTINNAEPNNSYEIFIINGDCSEFISNAETTKETVTVKEYINRHLSELEEFFTPLGKVTPDFLYALTLQTLEKNINYDFIDYFLNSYTQQRLIAYKIETQPSSIIEYSMPVDVQKNSTFIPTIFMTEITATGDYNIDYTIELNSNLPYVIESSAEIKKQADNLYTAENINSDFYFVFSSSQKPQSIYNDNNNNGTIRIVLFVILGIAICAFIVLLTLLIIHLKKHKK